MRHERRVLGRAAAALVLTGVMMAAGSLTAMAAGSTGAGTAPGPKDQGPGVMAVSEAEPEEKRAAVENGVIQPQNLEGAKDADQLVVVVGTGGCGADVYYYKKSGEAWEMAWKEAGIVGRNGITDQKAEGHSFKECVIAHWSSVSARKIRAASCPTIRSQKAITGWMIQPVPIITSWSIHHRLQRTGIPQRTWRLPPHTIIMPWH